MERRTGIKEAKQLYGEQFIGFEEIAKIASETGVQLPVEVPEIPFTIEALKQHASDCILILGVNRMKNGEPLTLMSLRARFGTDPAVSEPCFYNQDWYLKEDFMQTALESRWYLVRKNVFEDSRAVLPSILEEKHHFPRAVLCAYTFFTCWFHSRQVLWQNDFIWCSDTDHHNDRIYVGKYTDIDGINKNGFSIHRHLALKSSYAAISVY
jgi:hypothetical protein